MNVLVAVLAVFGALSIGVSVALMIFVALGEFIERRRDAALGNSRMFAVMTVSSGDDDEYIEWLEKTYWRRETT